MKTDVIINRDALAALKELPFESVHCCVTSPPYFALRDYGLDAQIGQEDTPEQYIDRLTAVFGELYRVLRRDGTLWLNIADTYCGTGNKGSYADPKNPKGRTGQRIARNSHVTGCKQKDLIGIPWLLAFSLRKQGWYLRSDIIWQKQNPMPESCKDRPTRCYEHIHVDHQLLKIADVGYYVETPKTKSGNRVIPMSEKVLEAFQRVLNKRKYAQPVILEGYTKFLFLNRNGLPKVAVNYESMFRGLVRKYNKTQKVALPKVMTPHTLRHTFCTTLANAGMNPKALQYIMGHSNINMTLNYYAHTTSETSITEMKRLIA